MVVRKQYKIVTVTKTTITKAGEHPVEITTTKEEYSDTPPEGYEEAVIRIDKAVTSIEESKAGMLEKM